MEMLQGELVAAEQEFRHRLILEGGMRSRHAIGQVLPLHDAVGQLIGIAAFLRDATARFEEIRGLRRELAELKNG